jgi:OHCU decarboxylase
VTAAPSPRLPAIDALNSLPRQQFVEALKPLFEAAGPLGDRLADGRPYASYEALLSHAEALVDALTPREQIVVANAHPRIGESAKVILETSALSYREQGYDAEAALPQDEVARVYADLERLNAEYEARFGFRFVVFVNGRSKGEILDVLRERITFPHDQELRTALLEMLAISRDRLRLLTAS